MNPTLFIADDNPADLELIQLAFEEAKVHVDCVTALDGVAAMKALETISPELVLLDINMPRADGFQVLRWLRSNARLREVPVIVMSSSSAERDRQMANELGALRLWTKPTRFGEAVSFAESLKVFLNQ